MSSSVDPLTISSNKEMFDNDLQVLNSTSEEVDPLSLRCLQEHNSTDMFEGKIHRHMDGSCAIRISTVV